MFSMMVEKSFSAAHYLPLYNGDCANLHGHNWRIKIAVRRGMLDDMGMVIDFKVLKKGLENILTAFDHKVLNETLQMPTAENIAEYIFYRVEVEIVRPAGATLNYVEVEETPGCSVRFWGNL